MRGNAFHFFDKSQRVAPPSAKIRSHDSWPVRFCKIRVVALACGGLTADSEHPERSCSTDGRLDPLRFYCPRSYLRI
jgi:hypothetical protein